ncbi:hypothetical protein PGT21_036502 [Puccinia graminis f. sp. tritici]|uniref:Uncharacterized protein n=1 Tax=Puccinia graminis f. sp. tritici TaxID=56615 RepID=A0A5B0QQ44_PUCGR|nr:hypothetical protein PGT21_036502 [Puccinia graminis f. sp. tritici]
MKCSRFLFFFLCVEISTAASPDDEEWHQLVDEYLQGSAEFGLTSPENGGRSYVREGQNSSKRGRVDPLGMPEANGMSASASESESRLIKEFGLLNALPPSECHQPSQASDTEGREAKRACYGRSIVTEKQRQCQDGQPRISRFHLDTHLPEVHKQQFDHAELPKSFAMGTESQQETEVRSGQPITAKKNGIGDQPGPSQLHLHDESWKQCQSHPSKLPWIAQAKGKLISIKYPTILPSTMYIKNFMVHEQPQ